MKRLFYSIPKDFFSQDDTSTLSKINSFHQPQQLLSKSSNQLVELLQGKDSGSHRCS